MARPAKKVTSPTGIDISAPSDLVEIASVKESWSECHLEDGTVLRIRPVVAEVRRLRNKFNELGEPTYIVKTAIITSTTVPKKLHKKPRKKVTKKT